MSLTASVLIALIPAALLIALGYGLRRSGFIAADFWPQAERLCYYVLLPALFINGLATADLRAVPVWGLAGAVIAATTAVSAIIVASRPLLRVDGAAFTSIFQGGVRFNNYVGVTLAVGVLGPPGVALAAICNAAIVPTVNVLCVLAFARFGATRLNGWRALRQVAQNPLILACGVGMALQANGVGLPPGVDQATRALGAASMPLGLLCVGAALSFGAARAWLGPVLIASGFKLFVMPAAAVTASAAFGLTDSAALTALLFLSLPTASSSYILARQLGGDAPLMAGVTAAQTLLAAVTIPFAVSVTAWGGVL